MSYASEERLGIGSKNPFRALWGGLLAALWLAGCGSGGGGGGTAPAAPTVTLSHGIKSVVLSWAAVSGADSYRVLESPDGGSTYNQIASGLTATAYTHPIFLPRRVNSRYIVSACNSAGCTDSAPVQVAAALVPAIGYFKASNTGAGDVFGASVALSADGNTLAVGAPYEESNATGIGGNQNDNSAADSGAVYLF
ncbi:MAG: hypothetical protein NZL99_05610 [Burkholderiaceae bacterium]|nr:hypothetical protein [Burkholderiaceae bacterium]